MENVQIVGLGQALSNIRYFDWYDGMLFLLAGVLFGALLYFCCRTFADDPRCLGWSVTLVLVLAVGLAVIVGGSQVCVVNAEKECLLTLEQKQDQIQNVAVSGDDATVQFKDGTYLVLENWKPRKNLAEEDKVIIDAENKSIVY